jgi:Uma2 family endonuclease
MSISLEAPPAPAEEIRFELTGRVVERIEGVLMTQARAIPAHQQASMMLSIFLGNTIKGQQLGKIQAAPSEIHFDPQNMLIPDLFVILKEGARCHLNPAENQWEGCPHLCIEILSPSSIKLDRGKKFKLYEAFGVDEYWILDPAQQTIEVYHLNEGGYELTGVFAGEDAVESPLLPGLGMKAGGVFE